jgi:hypothetical protein
MADSDKRPDGGNESVTRPAGMPSEDLAAIIVDALLRASIVDELNVGRAIQIVIEEIDARKALGDY